MVEGRRREAWDHTSYLALQILAAAGVKTELESHHPMLVASHAAGEMTDGDDVEFAWKMLRKTIVGDQ